MKRLVTVHPAVNLLVFVLLSCFVASSADAANRYVRSGATGAANGSDWTNAYPSLPATLTRGDTYYIATGNYGGYGFNTAQSGTTPITIKKATAADHGTDVGWSSSFGTGQAVFSGKFDFNSGWWVIDGQVGGGPGSWTSGFGFKVQYGGGSVIDISGSNITIRHVEAQGNGGDGDGTGQANDIVAVSGSNVTLSYAYLYGAGRCIYFLSGANLIFEYNYTGYHESTAAQHSEIASIWKWSTTAPANITYRYSVFTHAEGTGGLIMEGDGLFVYGNVFYKPAGDNWEHGNGLIGTWTVNTLTNVKVYNNSFINTNTGWMILGTLFTPPTTGNEARNNLFYSATSIGGLGSLFPTFSHNHYVDSALPSVTESTRSTATGSPVMNYQGLDFRLKAATPAGMTLPAPYNRDMFGNVRGADGTWDRGAVEFGGTTTTGPATPSNLSLN